MFEKENVVIQKNTDHGLSLLTENQKPDGDTDDNTDDNTDDKSNREDESFYSVN